MLVQKKSRVAVASAILALSLGVGAVRAWGVEGVSKDVVSATSLGAEGNYCHLKFPAIDPISFGSDKVVLQSADSGDLIDYYGPCDHDPSGKEELTRQMHERELYMQRGHGGY